MVVPETCEDCQKIDSSCIKQVKYCLKKLYQTDSSTPKHARNLDSKKVTVSRIRQNHQVVRNRRRATSARTSIFQMTKNARKSRIKPVKNFANK